LEHPWPPINCRHSTLLLPAKDGIVGRLGTLGMGSGRCRSELFGRGSNSSGMSATEVVACGRIQGKTGLTGARRYAESASIRASKDPDLRPAETWAGPAWRKRTRSTAIAAEQELSSCCHEHVCAGPVKMQQVTPPSARWHSHVDNASVRALFFLNSIKTSVEKHQLLTTSSNHVSSGGQMHHMRHWDTSCWVEPVSIIIYHPFRPMPEKTAKQGKRVLVPTA